MTTKEWMKEIAEAIKASDAKVATMTLEEQRAQLAINTGTVGKILKGMWEYDRERDVDKSN